MFTVLTNANLIDTLVLAEFDSSDDAIAYARQIAPLLKSTIPNNEEVSQSIHIWDTAGQDQLVIDCSNL